MQSGSSGGGIVPPPLAVNALSGAIREHPPPDD
jgi:hypothetical protein